MNLKKGMLLTSKVQGLEGFNSIISNSNKRLQPYDSVKSSRSKRLDSEVLVENQNFFTKLKSRESMDTKRSDGYFISNRISITSPHKLKYAPRMTIY